MWGWLNYILRRLLGAALTIVAGAIVVFLVMKAGPGDPAVFVLGDFATPAAIADFRQRYKLDDPILEQLWVWLGHLARGDFGASISLYKDRDIYGLIADRLPNTVFVGSLALVIAVVVALVAGGAAALRRGTPLDVGITTASVVGISMPDFWLGYILVLIFALHLQWFPAYGFVSPVESVSSAFMTGFLPALAIAAPIAAGFSRILRVSLLETLQRDYVRTARSFGVHPAFTFLHFALRNALIPFVTMIGLQVRFLLGGVVVIERIFGVPGIGSLMVDGIFARDYLIVQACAVTFLTFVVFTNLAVDLICAMLDPRRAH